MKLKSLLLATVIVPTLLVGCSSKSSTVEKPDAVASASITKSPLVFNKAIGKNGTWIIAITGNMTIDKNLILEGNFKDKHVPALVERKLALYKQNTKHAVIARYTLTAPELTIESPNSSIEHGIFKGDIYVETNTFKLVDNIVIGNIYFRNVADKAGFKMDANSSVTGK